MMTPEEIGVVYNALRSQRVLYELPVRGRRRGEVEKHAMEIMANAYGRFSDLEEFLRTQGLTLIVKETIELGLPGEGMVYAIIRDPDAEPPGHLIGDQFIRRFSDARRDETAAQTAVWGIFLSLVLLQLLYTGEGRTLENVIDSSESWIDEANFLDVAHNWMEEVRKDEVPEDERRRTIYETLIGPSAAQLERRVSSFMRTLVELGVLEEIQPSETGRDEAGEVKVYRQSVWSAIDIAENFRRYAPHLIGGDPMDVMVAVGAEERPAETSGDTAEETGSAAPPVSSNYPEED